MAALYFGVVNSIIRWSLLKSLIVDSGELSVYYDSTTVLHILLFLCDNLLEVMNTLLLCYITELCCPWSIFAIMMLLLLNFMKFGKLFSWL